MCLVVKQSFVKNPIPSAYCWKILKTTNNQQWITPYQLKKIPKTGILIPNHIENKKEEFEIHDIVYKGYIHAYTKFSEAQHILKTKKQEHYKLQIFKAIATDIIAIGIAKDLICKAIYIPELDLTIKS